MAKCQRSFISPGATATIDITSDGELAAESEQRWGSLKAQYRRGWSGS